MAAMIVVAIERRVPDKSILMKAGGATLYSVRNQFRVHARRSRLGEYSAFSNLPVNPIGHAPTRYQAPRKSRPSYRQLPGWQLWQHPSSPDVCIHDSPIYSLAANGRSGSTELAEVLTATYLSGHSLSAEIYQAIFAVFSTPNSS
jgi:hypothetical protein